MTQMTPREIVQELDRHIIGQADAKRAVAIALRNRWRRLQVEESLQPEITPKNILMIGPTGVGKTEIARRLATLAKAPFIKVEATKFTEVGYVGKDVESIIRDLAEASYKLTREQAMQEVRSRAEDAAVERVIDIMLPKRSSSGFADAPAEDSGNSETCRKMLRRLLSGELNEREIKIDLDLALVELAGQKPAQHFAPRFGIAAVFGGRVGKAAGRSFGQHDVNDALNRGIFSARAHLLHGLLAGELVAGLGQVADDGFHVLADIAHLGELGGLHLDERRLGERGQAARNFRLAHAGGANHEDVLGRDFRLQAFLNLQAPPAVAQRNGHRALGVGLADDVAVQFLNYFARGHLGHVKRCFLNRCREFLWSRSGWCKCRFRRQW